MRKLRTAIPLSLAGLLLTAILWTAISNQEPTYDGHRLSYWTDVESTNIHAVTAISHIGTNALPLTLKWLQYQPNLARERVCDALSKLPALTRPGWLIRWLSNAEGYKRAGQARFVLGVLGPQAGPLAPDLLHLATNTSSPGVSVRALSALGALGTNGLPELLDILQNAKPPLRRGAARVICYVIIKWQPSATLVAPALVQSVSETNPDPGLVVRVSEALGAGNPDPRLFVPTFRKFLTSTNATIRDAATNLLEQLAPEALTNAPAR